MGRDTPLQFSCFSESCVNLRLHSYLNVSRNMYTLVLTMDRKKVLLYEETRTGDEHFSVKKTFVSVIQRVRDMRIRKETWQPFIRSRPRRGYSEYNRCLFFIKGNRAICVIAMGSLKWYRTLATYTLGADTDSALVNS